MLIMGKMKAVSEHVLRENSGQSLQVNQNSLIH